LRLLPLLHNFSDCPLELLLQVSLKRDLSFKLRSERLVLLTGAFHHFLQLVNYSLIATDLLLVCLRFGSRGSQGRGLSNTTTAGESPLRLNIVVGASLHGEVGPGLTHLRLLPTLRVHSDLHELALWRSLRLGRMLAEGINVYLLLVFVLLRNGILELIDVLSILLVFFLLHHELADEELTIVLLSFVLLPELSILLNEQAILVVYSLSNRRDELKVMLHFILSLFQVTFLIAFERLLFFELLLELDHFRVELANNIILLLLLQLLSLRFNVLNAFSELKTESIDNRRNSLLLHLFISITISTVFFIFLNKSDSELPLELLNIQTVVLLSHDVAVLSPRYVVFYFLIVFEHLLEF